MMATKSGLSGIAVAEITAGIILIYSGIAGESVGDSLAGLLRGQYKKGAVAALGTGTSSATLAAEVGSGTGAVGGGSTTGNALADRALLDKGHCYDYGGAPGLNGQGCWDCSSATNFWCGSLGLGIPPYNGPQPYNGAVHGPATGDWLLWNGCEHTGLSAASMLAGDIACWQTHMGICIGNGEMISALDPAQGTAVTTIEGGAPTGEVLVPLRLKATIG